MNKEDKFTLCRIWLSILISFIILPYFVLIKKIHIEFWVSTLLLVIMWGLIVSMERLHDKESIIYQIILIAYSSVTLPTFLWVLLSVFLNH